MNKRGTAGPTENARGINVPHKRDHLAITVILPADQFQALKAQALKDCRSLSAQIRFYLLRSMKAECEK